MKKLLMLLCCLCLLTSCAPLNGPSTAATPVPGTDPILPGAKAPADMDRLQTATLFFRYLDEPYLAAETRAITHSPDMPFELALITELLAGPGTHATDLRALFPAGTQVRSTVTQGRTLFVTLTAEIMNDYPEEKTLSPEERKLRRALCMQSLVATVTENCDIDQVQVLVEQTETTSGSLRLQARYFLEDPASTELVGPLLREDAYLLTPGNTAKVIMSLWRSRDWQRLYQYIARKDPTTGMERVSYPDFVTAMENLPLVSSCALEGGSVTQDGSAATFTLDAAILQNGQESAREGAVLRLCREESIWRITLDQLTCWLEVQ